ncbi:hypothetical protein KY363_01545 [Candidatus Woesearchaeota archaeon]|nr:hypothetical protein [Candidatus Woesearchaeota archaeon]
MVKRKAERKKQAKSAAAEKTTHAGAATKQMPVPAFLMKVLAIFLSIILVIALTLYVFGKMPARGFWVLVIILAVIGFGVMPMMRKKFGVD